MYHGSRTANVDWTNIRLLFLTDALNIAKDYALGRVAFAGKTSNPIPNLYRVIADPLNIFDLRLSSCKEDYIKLRKDYPDEELPSLKSEGFIMHRTQLPSYGHVRGMRNGSVKMGYDSMYVDEGSQGISLAVFKSSVIKQAEKISLE